MKNKETVLITGASSGIGLELARLFAKDKYNLVIVSRDEQLLNDIALDLKSRVRDDLSRPACASAAISRL